MILRNVTLDGTAFKSVRDQAVIATKSGVQHLGTSLKTDSNPATIRKFVEGSLKLLGTDYIDVYFQHRIDPKVPAEDVASVMSELVSEGKIRSWGFSKTDEDYYFRNFMPQYTEEGFAKAQELIILLEQTAESKNSTADKISMAWMIYKTLSLFPAAAKLSV